MKKEKIFIFMFGLLAGSILMAIVFKEYTNKILFLIVYFSIWISFLLVPKKRKEGTSLKDVLPKRLFSKKGILTIGGNFVKIDTKNTLLKIGARYYSPNISKNYRYIGEGINPQNPEKIVSWFWNNQDDGICYLDGRTIKKLKLIEI